MRMMVCHILKSCHDVNSQVIDFSMTIVDWFGYVLYSVRVDCPSVIVIFHVAKCQDTKVK